MGAWGLGEEAAAIEARRGASRAVMASRSAGEGTAEEEAGNTVTELAGKVLAWIPGEVVVLYGALITLFVGVDSKNPDSTASIVLTAVGILLAAAFVVLAAWSSTSESGWLTKRIKGRAVLAAVAFVIWSLTVPNSGWQEITWIADHPAQTAGIAGVVGLIFSLIAIGADNRWAKKPTADPIAPQTTHV